MKPVWKEIFKGISILVCGKCKGYPLFKCQGLHTCCQCNYTHEKIEEKEDENTRTRRQRRKNKIF